MPSSPASLPVSTTSPDLKFQLPTELWIVIINYIIDEQQRPHLYCLPGTYPHFQAKFFNTQNYRADYALKTWKCVRAVCRDWKLLAGPSPQLTFVASEEYWRRQAGEPPNAHTLFLAEQELRQSIKLYSSIVIESRFDSLTTSCLLANSNSVINLVLGGGPFSSPSAIDQILDNYLFFPDLACLSISRTSVESSRSFWQRLQDGFPRLVSLTIRQSCKKESGTFLLPGLKFLDMYAWEGLNLHCPSLKHLSVENGCTPDVDEFLSRHGSQLQSLFLEWSDSEVLSVQPESLWTTFPNITTFGSHCSLRGLHPPSDHPLRHLRLFTNIYTKSDTIILVLDSFPDITHLYITRHGLKDISVPELKAIIEGRGVQLIEVAGDEEVMTAPQNVHRPRSGRLQLQPPYIPRKPTPPPKNAPGRTVWSIFSWPTLTSS
ncbi:hypothetical protein FRC18_003433 [Serendipita sp. 400]|nr:hypothetical protein FRC18_003433 [Serendipita sp. 400]